MALRTGLASQAGIAPESTFNTYVAPTTFLPVDKVAAKKVKNTVTPGGVTAGYLGQLASWRRTTTRAATASIEMSALNRKMGLLLQSLMGTTVTPVQQGGTAAYLQTHTLADTFGKSLTLQSGIPDLTGTVRPYTLTGCKVTSAEFDFVIDKEITAKFSIDAADMTEAQGLAAASFVTSRPFVGVDVGAGGSGSAGGVKIGASYGTEAAVSGVKKVTIKIDRGLDTDRFYFGSATKAEQVVADYAKITGTINADLLDKTVLADRFSADTMFYLVVEAVGALIAGAYYDTLRITLPGCFLDGDTPTADGNGISNGDYPFTWLYDGTNMPKIEYISADTTL